MISHCANPRCTLSNLASPYKPKDLRIIIRTAKKRVILQAELERRDGITGPGEIIGGCQSCQEDHDSGNPVASAH